MAAQLDAKPANLADTALSLVKAAPGTRARYTRTTLVRDPIGDGATATYHAHIDVAGFGPLDWNGVLPIVRVQQTKTRAVWRIHWQPDILYPGLLEGQHLTLQRSWLTARRSPRPTDRCSAVRRRSSRSASNPTASRTSPTSRIC